MLAGLPSQAAIDVFGRCLNGLDKRDDLRRSVIACLEWKNPKTNASFLNSMEICVKLIEASRDEGQWDERFIELSESLRQLNIMIGTIKAGKKPKPWRSVYCMERSLSGVSAGEDTDDDTNHSTMASCYVCGKMATDVKYCSRCKTVRRACILLTVSRPLMARGQLCQVMYCSKECQAADWKEHKQECVAQSRSTAPNGLRAVGSISKDDVAHVRLQAPSSGVILPDC